MAKVLEFKESYRLMGGLFEVEGAEARGGQWFWRARFDLDLPDEVREVEFTTDDWEGCRWEETALLAIALRAFHESLGEVADDEWLEVADDLESGHKPSEVALRYRTTNVFRVSPYSYSGSIGYTSIGDIADALRVGHLDSHSDLEEGYEYAIDVYEGDADEPTWRLMIPSEGEYELHDF